MSKWFIRPCKVDIGNMCRKMGINVPLALALQSKGLNTPKRLKTILIQKITILETLHSLLVLKGLLKL